jgi:hypothetical protein
VSEKQLIEIAKADLAINLAEIRLVIDYRLDLRQDELTALGIRKVTHIIPFAKIDLSLCFRPSANLFIARRQQNCPKSERDPSVGFVLDNFHIDAAILDH